MMAKRSCLLTLLVCICNNAIILDIAKILTKILKLLQFPVHVLYAAKEQKQRMQTIETFRSSVNGVLIATDVMGRGMDVPDVKVVIHYHVPNSPDVRHATMYDVMSRCMYIVLDVPPVVYSLDCQCC